MCGVIGIIAKRNIVTDLTIGLRMLEYRGYDSTGIATMDAGKIHRRRAEGKLHNLEKLLDEDPIKGERGIGHTRWATHGIPSERNAHPHITEHLAIVHNGIIENYDQLTAELALPRSAYISDTDTEVIAHWLTHLLNLGNSPTEAIKTLLPKLQGAFAFVVLFADPDAPMIAARRGSPLAIGHGDGEMYFGSDALALSSRTQRITYLEEGDWAVLHADSMQIYDAQNQPIERKQVTSTYSGAMIGKGNYRHFMLKEIHEQPTAFATALATMLNPATHQISLPDLPCNIEDCKRLIITACGTSFLAGMIGKYWLEQISRIPVEIELASELRYRDPPLDKLMICISQSGETMDTLSALRHAKTRGSKIISIINVPDSSMARESDCVLYTHSGPEIGVASTKTFINTLVMLAALAIDLALKTKAIDKDRATELAIALSEAPSRISEILTHEDEIAKHAQWLSDATNVLYIGRGALYPVALEGALKLKELSYIHAEGFAGGEMKHGPIALIDEMVPVIAVAPSGPDFDKIAMNIKEAQARGAKLLTITDDDGLMRLTQQGYDGKSIRIPKSNPTISPILSIIPIQLLAYYTAYTKGMDVDQPRNLAKSVTVE